MFGGAFMPKTASQLLLRPSEFISEPRKQKNSELSSGW